MLSAILSQIGLALLLGVWLFAWTKGGPGERWGASLVAAAWIGSIAVLALLPEEWRELSLLSFDFLLAAGLLLIAILYASPWLGVAMLLQGAVLALHAEVGMDAHHSPRRFIMWLNIASAGMLLAILASTVGAWMARRRASRTATDRTPSRQTSSGLTAAT